LKSTHGSSGFSLIELLVALVILSISLLALASLMAMTTQTNSFGSHLTEATTFAQDRLEALRVAPWANVTGNADQVTGATGMQYNRTWVVNANPAGNLRTVTITVNWNDRTNHSIRLRSAIPQ
jgi:type IV pilus assembly protein PilV